MELAKRKLYDITAPNRSTKIITGESSNVLNWDDCRFSFAYPLYKNMLANFWIADEINLANDIKQWNAEMSDDEKEIFLKIIGLLAFLDSVQTDFSGQVADYITDSSISSLMQVLSFQEVIHNQSYSYVLSSLVSQQKQLEVFDYWKHDDVLKKRNEFIAKGYEEFTNNKTPETFAKAIVFDIILEGIFFFSGFAFFYNLSRNGKMIGSSTMINYINKDELLHVRLFSEIYKTVLADYPELDTPEFSVWTTNTIRKAANLEIEWGNYLIGNRIDGIDQKDLEEYVKFMANLRAKQLGVETPFERINRNPLPWIKAFEDVNSGKTDFFEGKPRQYSKVSEDNAFDDL
jgi:ribonucleoside-diphosphate reductase beta chain